MVAPTADASATRRGVGPPVGRTGLIRGPFGWREEERSDRGGELGLDAGEPTSVEDERRDAVPLVGGVEAEQDEEGVAGVGRAMQGAVEDGRGVVEQRRAVAGGAGVEGVEAALGRSGELPARGVVVC